MNAVMRQAGLLKKIIDAIKELITEATFDCDQSGVYLQAMDSSHVALVSFLLKQNFFESYECERNISLGININSMSKILKCASNDDLLIMEAKEPMDTLIFQFRSKREHKISNFELRLMNLDIEKLSIPETEYSCVIEIPCTEFSKICHDLFAIGDVLTISCTRKGVDFIIDGDLGTANIRLKQKSLNDENSQDAYTTKIKITNPVSQSFSLRYLIFFAKASNLSNTVILHMGEDVPLRNSKQAISFSFIR